MYKYLNSWHPVFGKIRRHFTEVYYCVCKEQLDSGSSNSFEVYWHKTPDLQPIVKELYEKTGFKIQVSDWEAVKNISAQLSYWASSNSPYKCTVTLEKRGATGRNYMLDSKEISAVAAVITIGLKGKTLEPAKLKRIGSPIKNLIIKHFFNEKHFVDSLLNYLKEDYKTPPTGNVTGWISHQRNVQQMRENDANN